MIVGSCLLLFVGCTLALSPADVTYVEGRAPDDLKAGPDSKSSLFGNSASVQTKGFSANFNGNGNRGSNGNEEQSKYVQGEGSSSSIQTKGFSANFNNGNSGSNGNQQQTKYVQGQGSSSSFQTKGFSANFNSGSNTNQNQAGYAQQEDVSSTTSSDSVSSVS